MIPSSEKWQNVSSSIIEAISYEQEKETLFVKFHNGAIYSYSGVSSTTYLSLRNSDSVGKYFKKNIEKNHIHVKVRG